MKKYRPDTTAEVLKIGYTGCRMTECRNGIVRHGAHVGTGDLIAINSSSVISYRNVRLEFDKTGFGGNRTKK